MRNFTLLMGALLVAGTAAAEGYNFVKPALSSYAAPKYYKITSDRVLDLGGLDQEALDTITDPAELKQALKNTYKQYSPVNDGKGALSNRPWLGLYNGTIGAFAMADSLVPTYTMYWRLEEVPENSNPNAVRIANLASDMGLSVDLNPMALNPGSPIVYVQDLSGMEYNAKKWVINDNGNWVIETVEDSTSTFQANSFCFSKSGNYRNGSDCIDVNNYWGQAGTPYAGVEVVLMKAVWNPFTDGVGNLNNGSIFYFVEATEAEVKEAEEQFLASGDGQLFIDAARTSALSQFSTGFETVPALYNKDAVVTARKAIEALNFNASDCHSIAELNVMVNKVYAAANNKFEPVFKAADKYGVNFLCQEMRSYPIVDEWGSETSIDECAYLGCGDFVFQEMVDSTGEYRDSINPMCLMPLLPDQNTYEAPAGAEWVLDYAGGSTYRLCNKVNYMWIGQSPANLNQPWHTTWSKENAALFQIVGLADTIVGEDEALLDIVCIQQYNSGDKQCIHAGGDAIHGAMVRWERGSGTASDPGASASDWKIELVEKDANVGLESIVADQLTAAPTTAIYDLMGRRVANINRNGLYIVNGKKVLVNNK